MGVSACMMNAWLLWLAVFMVLTRVHHATSQPGEYKQLQQQFILQQEKTSPKLQSYFISKESQIVRSITLQIYLS